MPGIELPGLPRRVANAAQTSPWTDHAGMEKIIPQSGN